jgi:hypothetical protein
MMPPKKKPGAISRPGAIPQFLFPDSMILAKGQQEIDGTLPKLLVAIAEKAM